MRKSGSILYGEARSGRPAPMTKQGRNLLRTVLKTNHSWEPTRRPGDADPTSLADHVNQLSDILPGEPAMYSGEQMRRVSAQGRHHARSSRQRALTACPQFDRADPVRFDVLTRRESGTRKLGGN